MSTQSNDEELHLILAPITGDNTKAGDVRKAVELIKSYVSQKDLEELEGFMALAEKKAFDTQLGSYPAVYHADIDNYCIPRIEAINKYLKQESKE